MNKLNRVAAFTLGCKVNQYETEAVLEQFINAGYQTVEFSDMADIYIINTCTVTSLGDRKSRQMIRRTKQLSPNAVLVVMGCYSQTAPDEVLAIDEVDIVLGTSERGKVFQMVQEFLQDKQKKNIVSDIHAVKEFEELEITHYENRTRAFLKVQEGCCQYCSYCIIPYARGNIRSRSIDNAVKEAEKLVQIGFCEIVLVGIHLASYGKETGDVTLLDLMERLNEVEGLKRIRLGSLEPTFLTPEVITKIAAMEKVCRHFHLSLQSGCDETLKRMNRKYTTKDYKTVVENIRKLMPEAAITTDVMVGFPQESDEEFEQTYHFLEEIKLAEAHVFKYSIRKGTKAANMSGQVAPQVKEERSRRLISLTNLTHNAFLQQFLNREMEVLFEQLHQNKPNVYEGKTDNYITVISSSNENLEGKLLKVRLDSIENGVMTGTVLE